MQCGIIWQRWAESTFFLSLTYMRADGKLEKFIYPPPLPPPPPPVPPPPPPPPPADNCPSLLASNAHTHT